MTVRATGSLPARWRHSHLERRRWLWGRGQRHRENHLDGDIGEVVVAADSGMEARIG